MQKIINPRFLAARRRASRYGIGLEVPAYVRKHLEPKVEIGSKREPGPIEIHPAIHTPEPKHRLIDRDQVAALVIVVGFVALIAVEALS